MAIRFSTAESLKHTRITSDVSIYVFFRPRYFNQSSHTTFPPHHHVGLWRPILYLVVNQRHRFISQVGYATIIIT